MITTTLAPYNNHGADFDLLFCISSGSLVGQGPNLNPLEGVALVAR